MSKNEIDEKMSNEKVEPKHAPFKLTVEFTGEDAKRDAKRALKVNIEFTGEDAKRDAQRALKAEAMYAIIWEILYGKVYNEMIAHPKPGIDANTAHEFYESILAEVTEKGITDVMAEWPS